MSDPPRNKRIYPQNAYSFLYHISMLLCLGHHISLRWAFSIVCLLHLCISHSVTALLVNSYPSRGLSALSSVSTNWQLPLSISSTSDHFINDLTSMIRHVDIYIILIKIMSYFACLFFFIFLFVVLFLLCIMSFLIFILALITSNAVLV